MKIKALMTQDVRTCRPQDSLNEAARAMWESDCGCLPVVDEQARVVGMVTDRDVCMAAYTQGQTLATIPVSTAMARNVVSCGPDDDLAAVERSMQKARVRRLPVVDRHGRLAGIVSLNDLARQAFAERTQKTRNVGGDDIAATLAAIGEPRRREPKAAEPGPSQRMPAHRGHSVGTPGA